jgi:hypothetical protein
MIVALPPEPPAMMATDCSAADDGLTVLVVQQSPARQGATLRISAASGPWSSSPVPTACLTDWRIGDRAVTLSPDHAHLIIAPDARPGQIVGISAMVRKHQIRTEIRIVGREEVVLTGYWSQETVDCGHDVPPAEPVRELHFDDRGGYSVTFTPFETYKDYWGEFTFDAAASTIRFTHEGGNRPADGLDLAGTAALGDDGKLTLDALFLGDRDGPPGRSCRYVFVRQ